MVSLSTIYGVGAGIGTITAFVAAYVGHRIYPIQVGGNLTDVVNKVTETVSDAVEKVKETVTTPTEQPLNTEVEPLEAPVQEESLPQVELPTEPIAEQSQIEAPPTEPIVEQPQTEAPAPTEQPSTA